MMGAIFLSVPSNELFEFFSPSVQLLLLSEAAAISLTVSLVPLDLNSVIL